MSDAGTYKSSLSNIFTRPSVSSCAVVRDYIRKAYNESYGPFDGDLELVTDLGILMTQFLYGLRSEDVGNRII